MINPSYSVRMRESLKTINLHAFYHLFFRGYQKIYYSILIDKPESKLHVPIQSQSASLGTDTKYNDVTTRLIPNSEHQGFSNSYRLQV